MGERNRPLGKLFEGAVALPFGEALREELSDGRAPVEVVGLHVRLKVLLKLLGNAGRDRAPRVYIEYIAYKRLITISIGGYSAMALSEVSCSNCPRHSLFRWIVPERPLRDQNQTSNRI